MALEHASLIESLGYLALRLWPVWLALFGVLSLTAAFRGRLGAYGALVSGNVGRIGLSICLFWLFAALFADVVAPFTAGEQLLAMKLASPGAIDPETGEIFVFGGDILGRDVFSRMIYGSQVVLLIAPVATIFAMMVGITLGLPAAYFGGFMDTVLSFLANMVLSFPVILLFYILVTPGVQETSLPRVFSGILFLFPVIFVCLLFYTRYSLRPGLVTLQLLATLLVGGWIYAGLVFDADPLGIVHISKNHLNIFVAVVFAVSPSVFRIVRGFTLEIKTKDYIAAAQTRGEGAWYIMLWEMLPNARGLLVTDICLRIGYTTILLGTLGYLGLGLASESPDWGTAIKDSGALLRVYAHPALPPVIALMSLVLGLNLLADALREQAFRD